MEVEVRVHSASSWRWPLLLSVVFINIVLPSLVLSYGILLIHSVTLGLPLWLGLTAPATFIITYGLSQCWCRDAADTWGGPSGHRVMASMGLVLIVSGLVACAFLSDVWQAVVYGVFGGLGSSVISAQVDAVIFETYDSHLGIIRGLCFSGQSIGQSIFPYILSALLVHYGYPYMYIVLGGIMLQTLPALMFLKVDETIKRPTSFSRYSDFKAYAIFNNSDNGYTAELQLHNISKKCWKSPSDDNLDREDEFDNEGYDEENNATVTPPPSPEEKRRNVFGVEILPEIAEVSDEDEYEDKSENSTNKKRLSIAIKRLSTMGDSLSDYITKQVRRDSQASQIENFSEVEVTYDNIAPITEIRREKILNSFSFRCRSTYASMKRRMLMPSYRVYRLRRRISFLMYNINDTFIKPLTRSLSCWRFYPSVMLCFSKLSLTTVYLAALPTIAFNLQPSIPLMEINFLMTLYGCAWVCFMLATPWLAQTPKRNFQYIAVLGLMISTAACFAMAGAKTYNRFSLGCVAGGFGYGAVTSSWETVVQDFVGSRKWSKIHSTLETTSVTLLAAFVVGISFLIKQNGDVQFIVFILGIVLSVITIVWLILALTSIYLTKIRSFSFRSRWRM